MFSIFETGKKRFNGFHRSQGKRGKKTTDVDGAAQHIKRSDLQGMII